MKAFRRSLSYFPRVRRKWVVGMLCALPTNAADLSLPLIVAHVIDGLRAGTMTLEGALPWAAALVGITAGKCVSKYFQRFLVTGASRDYERMIRQDLFEHLVHVAPHDLGRLRTGDIMSRATADIEAIRLFLGPGIMYLSNMIVLVPVALTVMAFVNTTLTLAMLGPYLLLAVIVWVTARPTQRWSEEAQERLAALSTVAQESFSGIRVVKAFATEAVSAAQFREMGEAFLQANVRLATLRGLSTAAIHGIKNLGYLVILLVGGWQVIEGNMTVGGFWIFGDYLLKAFWPMVALGWMLGMYHRAVIASGRLERLFEIPHSVADAAASPAPVPVAGMPPAAASAVAAPAAAASAAVTTPPRQGASSSAERAAEDAPALEVRELSFAWDEATVLHDISFHLPAGGVLGITGRTGCGKSTLVQLISRQVDPPPGTVLLDGVDVRDVPLARLRTRLGVVPQDTFLFSETIHDNIAFAADRMSRDDVRRAARVARIDEDILEFPEGYDQMLGERGITLSGGQRQRTAIARALAADPPMLILDDCLSAVDAVTERKILGDLREALAGRTALIVSHRVAALSLADRILVLDDGRIIEHGTHEELVRAGGFYAELNTRQELEAEIEAL